MVMLTSSGGGRFEKAGAYVRAKRVGPFVFVAGTTAIEPVSTTVEARLTTPGMIVEIEIDAIIHNGEDRLALDDN